jgi:hypothetical protein
MAHSELDSLSIFPCNSFGNTARLEEFVHKG